jgi:hypothetical protein
LAIAFAAGLLLACTLEFQELSLPAKPWTFKIPEID